MDCSLPGSSIHRIFQERVLEWGVIAFSIKKAEHRRIDAFEVWCWRRLLRVPWTARRSNQPILKVFFGRTDAKAETPILGHLMQRVDSLGKTLMLGGIGGRRRRGLQGMTWLDGIIELVNSGSW